MAGTYAKYSPILSSGGGGGGGGITSINGDTTAAQIIAAGTGISVSTVSGTTTITNTEPGGDAFTIIQPDSGTSPTATSPTSTLTLHNSDGKLTIVGNSTTNTVTINTTGLQPSGNYITALAGDGTASGPGSAALTLATVNASPATYTYATVTVNAKGLVTSASSGVAPTGTVTSVALALPGIFTVTGSPVTTSGTLTATLGTQAANIVFAGPGSGSAAAPTFRALVAADIPSLTGSYASTTLNNLGTTAVNANLLSGTDATNTIGGSNASRFASVQVSASVTAGWNVAALSQTGAQLISLFGNNNPGLNLIKGLNSAKFDFDGTYLAYYNVGSGGHGLKMGVSSYIFQDSATNNVLATLDTTGFYLGNAALSTTATTGYTYVPTTAGTPTGVPTTKTGMAAILIDTTNGRFWSYYGGAWHFAILT